MPELLICQGKASAHGSTEAFHKGSKYGDALLAIAVTNLDTFPIVAVVGLLWFSIIHI